MRKTHFLPFLVLLLVILGCANQKRLSNQAGGNADNANQTANAGGQQGEQCSLKIDQAPEVKGFRLGMTAADVQKKVPQFKEKKPDEIGFYEIFFINPKPNDEVPSGIKLPSLDSLMVRLGFYKGRVIAAASYNNPNPAGIDLKTYVERVPESLKIPFQLKDENKNDNEDAQIKCDGFRILAGSHNIKYSSNWLPTTYWYYAVEETEAVKTVAERRRQLETEKEKIEKDAKQQAANSFKP